MGPGLTQLALWDMEKMRCGTVGKFPAQCLALRFLVCVPIASRPQKKRR